MTRKIGWLFLMVLLCSCNFSNKSTEEDLYYEKMKAYPNYISFDEPTKEEILNFNSEYYQLIHSDFYVPYDGKFLLTPYQDSIYLQERIKLSAAIDSVSKLRYKSEKEYNEALNYIYRNVFSLYGTPPQYIGKIDKKDILKYDKRASIKAFIYNSSKFASLGEEICIAYSEDNGKKWNYYHTGIIQGQPLYLKWYSEKPLIKDKNTLQVEAALLKFPPYSELMLSDSGEIEVIKDGLSAVFDLNILGKDSDGDGLTDLIEDWLFLDKLNPDTNNNGIPDNRDVNPRVNYPRTEFSKMYEAFIDDNILYDDIDEHSEGYLILSDTVPVITESSKTKTVLIITDNKDLMGALPATKRIICMTPEEYNTIRGPFRYGLDIMYLSTFFKVDRMRNTYKINVSYLSSDITYLVKKTSKGWRMKIISFIIS